MNPKQTNITNTKEQKGRITYWEVNQAWKNNYTYIREFENENDEEARNLPDRDTLETSEQVYDLLHF